jgi:hypothetical protein
MAAVQFGNPIALFILMKTDDDAFHASITCKLSAMVPLKSPLMTGADLVFKIQGELNLPGIQGPNWNAKASEWSCAGAKEGIDLVDVRSV